MIYPTETVNLIENWLTWLKALGGRSDKTINAYRSDIFKFINFMASLFVELKASPLVDVLMLSLTASVLAYPMIPNDYVKISNQLPNPYTRVGGGKHVFTVRLGSICYISVLMHSPKLRDSSF